MKAFVLMPFAPDFDDVFTSIIRAPLEAEGFTVERVDESRGTRNIMHDVLQGIALADLVIADLTGANPNVFYELGIAHALGVVSRDVVPRSAESGGGWTVFGSGVWPTPVVVVHPGFQLSCPGV